MPPDPFDAPHPIDRFRKAFACASAALERDDRAWTELWDDPAVRAIAYIGVPESLNPYQFAESGCGSTTCNYQQHLHIVERLARGGASALLALPSPGLAGTAMVRFGSEEQQARFFAPFTVGPAWAFFAVTEPGSGSDATKPGGQLRRAGGGWRLDGTKTLIGGAARAAAGIVLAQVEESGRPVFVLLNAPANGDSFRVEPLRMTGLAGAGLCTLHFNGHRLPADAVLGASARTPAVAALAGVFERHRPMVVAMALGTVRAMLDSLGEHGVPATSLLWFRNSLRALLRRLAALGEEITAGICAPAAISLLKWQAVQLADHARAACGHLAPAALAGDPTLRRLVRDAGAFEYMEGTSNIHVLASYRAYRAGSKLLVRAA